MAIDPLALTQKEGEGLAQALPSFDYSKKDGVFDDLLKDKAKEKKEVKEEATSAQKEISLRFGKNFSLSICQHLYNQNDV